MTTLVIPNTGYYVVRTLDEHGPHTEQVDKAKHCTCGGSAARPCPHIEAITAYLALGGELAPAAEERAADLPESCPICDSPVISQGTRWRCIRSPGHYWHWRGEHFGVKAFLTQPHPAKSGAFYEQTPEERDAFLEAVSHKHAHYSPYG